MKSFIYLNHAIFGAILLLFSCNVFSTQTTLSPDSKITTIEMAAGLPKPPFITAKNQGIQLDVVRKALALQNIKVKFVHMPFGRNVPSYQRFNLDGVLTVPKHLKPDNMYLSAPYIRYQNIAATLHDSNLVINRVDDLAFRDVIAFQRARHYLGKDYEAAIDMASKYREVAEQMQQVTSLFLKHTEVIILDINIFKYYLHIGNNQIFTDPYEIHPIFEEYYYSAGFRDKVIQEKFDQGIKTLKKSGEYQKILDGYLD